MFKKITILSMCLIILCISTVSSFAVDESSIVTRASSRQSILSISENTAYCGAIINDSSTTTKIVITMTLQQKTLFWWSTEQIWTTTQYKSYASWTKTATVSSDTYRVKTVFEVYTGSDVETYTIYSSEVSC